MNSGLYKRLIGLLTCFLLTSSFHIRQDPLFEMKDSDLQLLGFIYPYKIYQTIPDYNNENQTHHNVTYIFRRITQVSSERQQYLHKYLEILPQKIFVQPQPGENMEMRILENKYFLIENSSLIIENEVLNASNKTFNLTKYQQRIQTYRDKHICVYSFDLNFYVFSELQDANSTNSTSAFKEPLKKLIQRETSHIIKSVTPDQQLFLWDIATNGSSFRLASYEGKSEVQVQNQAINQSNTTLNLSSFPLEDEQLQSFVSEYIHHQKQVLYMSEQKFNQNYLRGVKQRVPLQINNFFPKFLAIIADPETGDFYLMLSNENQFIISTTFIDALEIKSIKKFIDHTQNIYIANSYQNQNPEHFIYVNKRRVNKYSPISYVDKFRVTNSDQYYFGIIFKKNKLGMIKCSQKQVKVMCKNSIFAKTKPYQEADQQKPYKADQKIISIEKIGDKFIGVCSQIQYLDNPNQKSITQYNCRVYDAGCQVIQQFPRIPLSEMKATNIHWKYSSLPFYTQQNSNQDQLCQEQLKLTILDSVQQITWQSSQFIIPSCIQAGNVTKINANNISSQTQQLNDDFLMEIQGQNWFREKSLLNEEYFRFDYLDDMMRDSLNHLNISKELLSSEDFTAQFKKDNRSDCTINFEEKTGLVSEEQGEKHSVYGTVQFNSNWKLCKLFIQPQEDNLLLQLSSRVESLDIQQDGEPLYQIYKCKFSFLYMNPQCHLRILQNLKQNDIFLSSRSSQLIYIVNNGVKGSFQLEVIDINSQQIRNILHVTYWMIVIFTVFIGSIVLILILKKMISYILIFFNVIQPNNVVFTYPLGYWELKIKVNSMINKKLIKFMHCTKERMEEDCCFCLQSIGEQKILAQFYCRHFFHKSCVEQWFRQEAGQLMCPMCKRKLNKTGAEQYMGQSGASSQNSNIEEDIEMIV